MCIIIQHCGCLAFNEGFSPFLLPLAFASTHTVLFIHQSQNLAIANLLHQALGTAPGGLIEGIADYVRLRSGLAPPHWRPVKALPPPVSKTTGPNPPNARPSLIPQVNTSPKDGGKPAAQHEAEEPKWDAGYDKTAFFLDWLDKTYGHGIVARMNEELRETKYDEKEFWTGLFGDHVGVLWKKYRESLADGGAVGAVSAETKEK